ncbi:MAG: FAD-dependent oxidoreductase [Victivallales bacterium]|nr:FAD-dependent oxidoreductase [Victivallales bacterium]
MRAIELKESIPVVRETDVLVVGGGPAGVAAALSAARQGLDVTVVEQTNCLGGIATSGLHGHICQYCSWGGEFRVVGGICDEFARSVSARGYGAYDERSFDFEVEALKLVLEEMFLKEKINILYYTQFSDVVVEDGNIRAVVIQSKNGREAVAAKIVIDATGDADVAARAGAPFEKGRADDGATQPMTLMFQIGGVDFQKVHHFREKEYPVKYGDSNKYKLHKLWKEAQDNGDMEPFQDGIMGWWHTPTRPDQLGINFTHIFGKDCTRMEDLTFATIEGRRQAFHTVDVYRKYVPGMEGCWMSHCAAMIGTRESRRIVGEYVITEQDLMAQRDFDDSIGYGSFFIDVHNCTGPGMDSETWNPPKGFKYQIPYRALLPKNVSNLLVAGRCISCTHVALGSLRVMPQCMIEGEAAGAAAAMAVESKSSPRNISIGKLQDTLRKSGAIVLQKDIVKRQP